MSDYRPIEDPETGLAAAAPSAWMRHAVELATRGAGRVAPNPMVGAVLVAGGRIIGQGFHRQYGGPHAEVDCLDSVAPDDRHLIASADLFVTLEPCAHFGKTPPCADRIIQEKIPRVWVGCRDPFPAVNGRGIERMKAAGIKVQLGLEEDACRHMNRRFFVFHEKKRPYIILKWAQTADGYIGAVTNEPRLMISNDYSNRLVHRWRSEESAILIGRGTAQADDPQLTNRYWQGPQPQRIVLDPGAVLSTNARVFSSDAPTRIFNRKRAGKEGMHEWIEVKEEEEFLPTVLSTLYRHGIQSVLVEGGAITLQHLMDAGYWDEARVIIKASLRAGKGIKAPLLQRVTFVKRDHVADDTVDYFLNQEPA